VRDDKKPENATSAEQVCSLLLLLHAHFVWHCFLQVMEMYQNQKVVSSGKGKKGGGDDD
jgi:hypothetical protein